jgi:16S rRNA pseudouridine516 synthase
VVVITVEEGRYHQVRRMFAAVGRTVLALHREAFGSLVLDDLGLAPGEWTDVDPARLER